MTRGAALAAALEESATELEGHIMKLEQQLGMARKWDFPDLAARIEVELQQIRPWAVLARLLVQR